MAAQRQEETEDDEGAKLARDRAERAKRENLVDLADARSMLAMGIVSTRPERRRADQRGTDKVPVGAEFESAPWEFGDDPDRDPEDKPNHRYVPSQGVADLVASGHGFFVRRDGTNPALPTHCQYCTAEIPIAVGECEFGPIGDCWESRGRKLVKTAPRKCQCNGCKGKIRNRGRQPVRCGKPECRRKLKREQKRKERKRVALNA